MAEAPADAVADGRSVFRRRSDPAAAVAARDGERAHREGSAFAIEGTVFDGAGRAVDDALVEIWQANAHGRYRHALDAGPAPLDPEFFGFGRCPTDANGVFHFDTVKPGAIHAGDGRRHAPHLNVTVFARGMLVHAFTRMYFDDDALEPIRRWRWSIARAAARSSPSARWRVAAASSIAGTSTSRAIAKPSSSTHDLAARLGGLQRPVRHRRPHRGRVRRTAAHRRSRRRRGRARSRGGSGRRHPASAGDRDRRRRRGSTVDIAALRRSVAASGVPTIELVRQLRQAVGPDLGGRSSTAAPRARTSSTRQRCSRCGARRR